MSRALGAIGADIRAPFSCLRALRVLRTIPVAHGHLGSRRLLLDYVILLSAALQHVLVGVMSGK